MKAPKNKASQNISESQNKLIQVPSRVRNQPFNTKGLHPIVLCDDADASVVASVRQIISNFYLIDYPMENTYRPAKLVIPSSGQRWYIKMYVFDASIGKVVRKRFYGLPKDEDSEIRLYKSLQVCNELNIRLSSGMISNRSRFVAEETKPSKVASDNKLSLLLSVAVLRIVNSKRGLRERTKTTYLQIVRVFCSFIQNLNHQPTVGTFVPEMASQYINFMMDSNYAMRTINNHILTLRTIWQDGIALKYFQDNPWKSIPRRKTPTGRNIAYLPHQVQEILEYSTKYPYLKLLIKFMYYTLMRTNELGHLQVKHIGMYTQGKIYLPAHLSKNNMERHIVIPPALMQEIQQHGILKMNPEWYLFGKEKFKPGPVRMPTVRMGQKYREWVLSKLNYPADYTLYSWKHTGVIAAHKAGVKDDDIMLQTGHKDYGSFQMYLKSLSLFENENFARLIPTI